MLYDGPYYIGWPFCVSRVSLTAAELWLKASMAEWPSSSRGFAHQMINRLLYIPGCCWWRRQLLVSFRILLRGPFTFLLVLNTYQETYVQIKYTLRYKNNKANTSRLFSTSHYYYYMRTNSLSTRRWTIGHDLVVHGICENTHRIDCMVYFFG